MRRRGSGGGPCLRVVVRTNYSLLKERFVRHSRFLGWRFYGRAGLFTRLRDPLVGSSSTGPLEERAVAKYKPYYNSLTRKVNPRQAVTLPCVIRRFH